MVDGNLARAMDRADQEIDLFIEKRAKANAEAKQERRREEGYLGQRDDHREEWADYYRRASTLERMAEENRERADALEGRIRWG